MDLAEIQSLGPEARKKELVSQLTLLIGDTVHAISGPHARDLAIALSNQQQLRWSQLLSFIDNVYDPNNTLNSVLTHLRDAIQPNVGAGIKQNGNDWVVSSSFPILQTEPADSTLELAARHPLLSAAIITSKCERALASVAAKSVIDLRLALAGGDAARLAAPATTDSALEDTLEKYRITFDAFQRALNEAVQAQHISENRSAERLRSIEESAKKSATAASESMNSLQKELDDWRQNSQATIDGLRKEVAEYMKIESSISLWRKKANWHTASYILLSAIFVLSLVGISALVIAPISMGYELKYVTEVVRISATQQYLSIALVLIPTLALGWVLRFIARLAMQNMALAHDARQRHTQVTTYLRLLSDPNKPISEKERILALAALFRPIAGSGPDDVNPPTIAELLKEAQDRIQNPK